MANARGAGFFEQVVELDEKNEKGWFWLASVVDSDEERRICLSNVLHINPNNERAKRALDALQAKAKEQKTAAEAEEVVAGVTRRQMTVIIGIGVVAVIVILIIALTVIVGNNNREAAERSTATGGRAVATNSAQAARCCRSGDRHIGCRDRHAAGDDHADRADARRADPAADLDAHAISDAAADAGSAAAADRLVGEAGGLGRSRRAQRRLFAAGLFQLRRGQPVRADRQLLRRKISLLADGQRVVYTVYDQLLFGSSLEAINLNGTQIESLPERWRGQNVFEPQMPHYGGPFKQYVVFVARTDRRQTTQVFMLDLNPPQGLTAAAVDGRRDQYTDPVLSPDGKIVIAVKATRTSPTRRSIWSASTWRRTQVPVTNDGELFTESSPHCGRHPGHFCGCAVEPAGQQRHLHQERRRQRLDSAVLSGTATI